MAVKVYCIVKRGEEGYYIPVKATSNPYNGEAAYLACLPNFFGGNKNYGETDEQTLIREVCEESQQNICLPSENLVMHRLFEFSDRHTYRFYLIEADSGIKCPDRNCLALDMQKQDPAKREMSCIIKIPVTNNLAGKDVNSFLQLCQEIGGNFVNIDPQNPNGTDNNALTQWKTHTGTQDAFKVLFRLR